jgi:hypothetical protein
MFTVPTAGRTIRFDFIDRLFFSVRSSLKVERVYLFHSQFVSVARCIGFRCSLGFIGSRSQEIVPCGLQLGPRDYPRSGGFI